MNQNNPIAFYNDGSGEGLPSNKFKISPSSFETFWSKKWKWFDVAFMGNDLFEPNNGSCTGNIVHYMAECYANNTEPKQADIDNYIDSLPTAHTTDGKETLSPATVRSRYLQMYNTLEQQYLSKVTIAETEPYVWQNFGNSAVLAGSIDAIRQADDGSYIIVDYKTYTANTPTKKMEYKHRLQASLYAIMLQNKGYNISAIEIVYVKTATEGPARKDGTKKQYPSEVTVFTEDFEPDFIKSLLELVVDTIDQFVVTPKLAHILFMDNRLKNQQFDVSKFRNTTAPARTNIPNYRS